jgi:DNA-binding MarR family transcriptional regulator
MIEEYLNRIIGLACVAKSGANDLTKHLPVYLRDAFKFSLMEIDGQDFLLLEPADEALVQVSQVVKFSKQIQNRTGLPTLVRFATLNSSRRRTLITNRENFIVPDKQIYIPFMRIYLNENAGSVRPAADKTTLSPSAQLLLLYHLQKQSIEGMPFKNVAEVLGYSRKTISVVVTELRRFDLCETESADERAKVMRFKRNGRELWNGILPLTASPILKVWRIDAKRLPSDLPLRASSDTALAHYTFIADSSYRSFAVDKKAFLERIEELQPFLHQEEGDSILEVWKYDPAILADGQFVDKLSLSLCYMDLDDERVKKEIIEMTNSILCPELTN